MWSSNSDSDTLLVPSAMHLSVCSSMVWVMSRCAARIKAIVRFGAWFIVHCDMSVIYLFRKRTRVVLVWAVGLDRFACGRVHSALGHYLTVI